MREDGRVSVDRRTWRTSWAGNVQRVSERIADAHNAEFLVTVRRGGFGRAAVWQAVFPDQLTVLETRTVSTDGQNPVTVRKTTTVRGSGNPDCYDPHNRPRNPTPLPERTPVLCRRPTWH
jgi:hypothetical protein